MKVHYETDTSWGDSYDMRTFELGTGKQAIIEKTIQQYNDPN